MTEARLSAAEVSQEPRTYRVQFLTTASTIVEVEATSAEEARVQADEDFYGPQPCAQCSGWGGQPGIELGEWEQDESEHGVWTSND